jgi:hypothetical protein
MIQWLAFLIPSYCYPTSSLGTRLVSEWFTNSLGTMDNNVKADAVISLSKAI